MGDVDNVLTLLLAVFVNREEIAELRRFVVTANGRTEAKVLGAQR